jgi:rod shape-determining protein MreC
VAYKDGHFSDLKVPLAWTVALALVVAAVVAIALLMSDRRETVQSSAYGATRATWSDSLRPRLCRPPADG